MRLFLVSTLLIFGVTFSSQASAESASAVYNGDGTATYSAEGNTDTVIINRMPYLGASVSTDILGFGVGGSVTAAVDATTRCWVASTNYGDSVDIIGSGCLELGIGPVAYLELQCSGAGDGTANYAVRPQTPIDTEWTWSKQYLGYPAETWNIAETDGAGTVGTLFSTVDPTAPFLTSLSVELKIMHGDTVVASGSITRAECGYAAPPPRGTIDACPSGKAWVDGTLTRKGYAYLDGLVQRWECLR